MHMQCLPYGHSLHGDMHIEKRSGHARLYLLYGLVWVNANVVFASLHGDVHILQLNYNIIVPQPTRLAKLCDN